MGPATAAPPPAVEPAAVAAVDDADAQAALELKKKGDAAFRAQNFEAAYEHYAKALAHNPSSTVLLGNRAFAAQKLGRRREALLDSKRCVELEPEWAKGWYRLGSALLACDWAAEAVEAFKHGLELAPNNRELKTGHEQALEQQQRRQQSASRKDSHSVANGSVDNGTAMLSNGSSSSSLVDANESANADSQEEQAMAVGSERGLDDGNSMLEQVEKEAAADLSEELRSQIWDTLNGEFVAEAPTKHGEPDVSMPPAPKAPPEESSERPSAVQAEPDTSMPTASQESHEEDLQAQRVAQAEAFKTQGNEHYKNGRYDEAMEAYGEAINLVPNEAAYHGNRAAAALMLRRYSEAAAGCIQATTLDPTYTRGYARAGKAYLAMGLVDQARAQYKEALRRDPGNRTLVIEAEQAEGVATMLRAAEAALDSNQPDRALSLAENALTHAPASERLLMIKCKALLQKERYPDAVAASRDLTWHGDANASEVLVIRGEALYRSGNMPLAQRIFEEAMRRDPDSSACRIGLKRVRQLNQLKESGNAAFKDGRWQEAFDCYTSALAVDSSLKSDFMATVACNRAAAASKLGNHKQAMEDCDRAIACNPDFVKAFLRRAAAKMALEQFDDAVRDYERVKQLDPSTPNISQSLKDAQLALKKSKRVDYYKILEIDKTATDADIKKAYRKQALRWHPDKQQSSSNSSSGEGNTNKEEDQEKADKMFKLIGEANAVLSDPAKRRKFDAGYSLEEIENGSGMHEDMFGGFGGGVSMADLFGHGHGHGGFAGFRQGPSPFSQGRYSRHY